MIILFNLNTHQQKRFTLSLLKQDKDTKKERNLGPKQKRVLSGLMWTENHGGDYEHLCKGGGLTQDRKSLGGEMREYPDFKQFIDNQPIRLYLSIISDLRTSNGKAVIAIVRRKELY